MNKELQTSSKFKRLFFGLIAVLSLMAVPLPAFAIEKGAYTVLRTTSYANPETGETVDGGTNIALGDSMCESIVEKEALIEQSNDKTYVTLGIGMMSNISDVKIQVQSDDGTYREAEIISTGSHELDGDNCNHYRFEVDSADRYISPILYVDPMGREVQFFIKLNMETAEPGTGEFLSEMIPLEQQTEKSEAESNHDSAFEEKTETKSGKVTKETKAESEEPAKKINSRPAASTVFAAIAGVVLVAAGIGGVVIYTRRKK